MKRLAARTSHTPNDTHDHSEITASDVSQTDGSFKRPLDVVTRGLISDVDYDYFTRVLSGTDNEIETWTYRNGGSGGTIVAVVVATYTDSYRDDLVTVDRTI